MSSESQEEPTVLSRWIGIAWFAALLVCIAGLATVYPRSCGRSPETEASPAACRSLAPVPGPEDLVYDSSNDRLLVSSQDRRSPTSPGSIWSVPLGSAAPPRALRLRGRDSCSFHPHGIDLTDFKRGPQLLYVINHHGAEDSTPREGCVAAASSRPGQEGTSLEVFEVREDHLLFLQRLADPEVFTNGNDVAAGEGREIWVTSPPTKAGDLLREQIQGHASSEILRFDCTAENGRLCIGKWYSAESFGRYVNGIAYRDRTDDHPARLYVASTLDKTIQVLDVGADRGVNLWEKGEIPLEAGPDNLSWVDESRTVLLAASHPEMRRFYQHAASGEAFSPSEVWAIPVDRRGEPELFFRDDGSRISGISVAVAAGDALFLGQVFSPAVLRCDLPPPALASLPPRRHPETKGDAS